MVLADPALLPTVDANGLITDGSSRILGQVITAPPVSVICTPLNSPSESIITNPFSLPVRRRSSVVTTPGEAETEASQVHSDTFTNKPWLPVYDRNFDVGVNPR
jgi:hypothetical protein